MREFVYITVAVIGCLGQLVQSQNEGSCVGKDDGTAVDIGIPCTECHCYNGELGCYSVTCPAVVCHPKLMVHEEGTCCPTCQDGCYDDNFDFGYIEAGSEVSDEKGCLKCTCSENSEFECQMASCVPCEGHFVDDGTCCGKCEVHKCKVDGLVYEAGDNIDTRDPCETCYCEVEGDHVDVLCMMMTCVPCPGIWFDDGTCCGSCDTTACLYEDIVYSIGQSIITDDPCKTCHCFNNSDGVAEVECAQMMCDECPGIHKYDGTCCGICEPIMSCFSDGIPYPIGIEMPPRSPCEVCRCELDSEGIPEVVCAVMDCAPCEEGFEHMFDGVSCCGQCVPMMFPLFDPTSCDSAKCPALPCPKGLQYKADDACCPQCKCLYKRKRYMPGPFGGKCDACMCNGDDGKVSCTEPVCAQKSLECVDAVQGEDCCYHCPNGKTCSMGSKRNQVVIKYGEYKFRKGKLCTCAGDPWHPSAFCVRQSPSKFLLRSMGKYRNQLADYMKKP